MAEREANELREAAPAGGSIANAAASGGPAPRGLAELAEVARDEAVLSSLLQALPQCFYIRVSL